MCNQVTRAACACQVTRGACACQRRQTEWAQRLEELRNFKRATGHCSVPMKYPSNPGLARWVHTQRMRRRNGKMSAGRARLLEKLGFIFEGRSQWEQVVRLSTASCPLPRPPRPPPRVIPRSVCTGAHSPLCS